MSADDQLATGHVPHMFLVEKHFASGIWRLCTWNHNVQWRGHTWLGLGTVVAFGRVSETEDLAWPKMQVGLNLANPAMLALARGPASEYRRRDVLCYLGVLDDQLRLYEDDEDPYWAGVMDQISLATGNGRDQTASVVMNCEVPGRDGRHAQSLRMNDAQQQARYPGDTGLSRIEQLTGKPVPWVSVKFQRR